MRVWRRKDARRRMWGKTQVMLKVLRQMGYRLRFNQQGLGRITPRWRLAVLPKPTTPWRSFVLLHELAHALLGYGGTPDGEAMATDFALRALEEAYLPLGKRSRLRVALYFLAHLSEYYGVSFNEALNAFVAEYPVLGEVAARIIGGAVSAAQRLTGPR